MVVDAVATLGAYEILVDQWKIDAAFSGSQKALGAPAGLAPVTFGPRAVEKFVSRKKPTKVYYFDARKLGSNWGCFNDARRL